MCHGESHHTNFKLTSEKHGKIPLYDFFPQPGISDLQEGLQSDAEHLQGKKHAERKVTSSVSAVGCAQTT